MDRTYNLKKNLTYLALGLAAAGCSEITPSNISWPITETVEKKSEQSNTSKEKELEKKKISIEEILNENGIEPEYEYTTRWWEYPINITGAFVLDVVWHEFGHYTVANLISCENVEFHGPDPNKKTISSVSHNCSGDFRETIVHSSGAVFTTAGNLALTGLLKNDDMPDFMRSFTATTSLMMMLDRHRYIWTAAIQNYAHLDISTSNDLHNIMKLNFDNQTEIDTAYGIVLTASAFELFLRREELGYLIFTALGKKVKVPEGIEGIKPGLYPVDKGFMIGIVGDI
ncbi:MAG: hypothetical protein AABX24_01645 [Nanoarchaeota archaeon]